MDKLVLPRDSNGSVLSTRRRLSLSSIDMAAPQIALEIGAADNPTVREQDGFSVRYADYFSAQELRDKWLSHGSNRDATRLVDVSYVIKGPILSPFISDTVDLLIANHVIEHICNPINWLRDLAKFCSDNSTIFMAIPDQRYTFDYFKQPTDITGIVRAFEEEKSAPDAFDVARFRYLHTRIDLPSIWSDCPGIKKPDRMRTNYRDIFEQARIDVSQGYVDVHCHFYTQESFIHIFSELYRSGYIPWKTELIEGVMKGGNEFHVVLRKD